MAKIIEFDTTSLKSSDLVELPVLIDAFKQYLKKELHYGKRDADFAASDLENPYHTPFIMQDYVDTVEFAGVSYEVRFCHTDFCACGLFHLANTKSFEFYMLFDQSTMPDRTARSYANARKVYVLC